MTEGAAPEKRGVLTKHDIVREEVVRGHCPQNLQPAAYDVRVGHIITADDYVFWDDQQGRDHQGRYRDSLSLKPGETATLASLEEIDLVHKDINALIVPRNRPAQRGLLTLNAGHVDPGHDGFVTAQVINLGKQEFPVTVGCSYFSIIFEYLSTEAESPRPPPLPTPERLGQLSQQATHLARSIIEVQKEELERSLREHFLARSDLTRELWNRGWVFVMMLFGFTVGMAGIVAAVIAALERWA